MKTYVVKYWDEKKAEEEAQEEWDCSSLVKAKRLAIRLAKEKDTTMLVDEYDADGVCLGIRYWLAYPNGIWKEV